MMCLNQAMLSQQLQWSNVCLVSDHDAMRALAAAAMMRLRDAGRDAIRAS
jgi:hypothetical protein